MTCSQCGIINAPGAVVCVHCGAPLTGPPDQPAPPSPSADQPGADPAQGPPPAESPPAASPPPPPPGGAADQSSSHPPPASPGGAYSSGEQPAGGAWAAPGGAYASGEQPAGGAYTSGEQPVGGAYGGPPGPPPAGPGYPSYPPGYPVGPPGPGKRSGRGPLLVLLGVLVVGAIVAGAVLVLGGDDDTGGLAGASIRLEPVGSTQDDDFAGNLDLEPLGESIAVALGDQPALDQQVSTGLSGQVATGTEPGLYGGSQDVAVCNIQALVDFLASPENQDKAQAWAEVQGISVDGIADFIAGLTPVRLRFDTRVTNHGFDGGATPFQSVLEAGTAVLVDATGAPRVKCNCGNPLLPPEPVSDPDENRALDLEELAENPDDAWDRIREDPGGVVSIEEGSEQLDGFVLVELEGGRIFQRPVGTDGLEDETVGPDDVGDLCTELVDSPTCQEPELGTGDVQITLRWDSTADLDLHVTDPNGEEIYFQVTSSSSGGQLDVDANAGCNEASPAPVENIFWPEGQAPGGTYQVSVEGYSDCDVGPSDYTLTVRVNGEEVLEETGTVGEGEANPYSFEG